VGQTNAVPSAAPATKPRTVVFFHAHPDDEALLTSGTMAHLAEQGHRVVLVVATAGESGLAGENYGAAAGLGRTRMAELQASALILGVSRVEVLGYADSGLASDPAPPAPAGRLPRLVDADPAEAAERLARILREERASVLTSYDRHGGYGHPDHVAVHRIGALAAERAATPVLLEATVPRDLLLRAARVVNRALPRSRRIDLRPWESAYCAAAEVTHRIDVWPQRRHRRAAMRAHASQATADAGMRTLQVFLRVPPPLFGWVFGREWYRQPGVRPPARRYAGVFDTLSG
jgi:LmbE family N-acetylglucosaminyl deacetylase